MYRALGLLCRDELGFELDEAHAQPPCEKTQGYWNDCLTTTDPPATTCSLPVTTDPPIPADEICLRGCTAEYWWLDAFPGDFSDFPLDRFLASCLPQCEADRAAPPWDSPFECFAYSTTLAEASCCFFYEDIPSGPCSSFVPCYRTASDPDASADSCFSVVGDPRDLSATSLLVGARFVDLRERSGIEAENYNRDFMQYLVDADLISAGEVWENRDSFANQFPAQHSFLSDRFRESDDLFRVRWDADVAQDPAGIIERNQAVLTATAGFLVDRFLHAQPAARGDTHLPVEDFHSLDQALDYLDKGRSFLTKGGVFTDGYIDAYIELKMQEVTRYRMTTHPLEFEMYYSL